MEGIAAFLVVVVCAFVIVGALNSFRLQEQVDRLEKRISALEAHHG
jgi:hypothetical protein